MTHSFARSIACRPIASIGLTRTITSPRRTTSSLRQAMMCETWRRRDSAGLRPLRFGTRRVASCECQQTRWTFDLDQRLLRLARALSLAGIFPTVPVGVRVPSPRWPLSAGGGLGRPSPRHPPNDPPLQVGMKSSLHHVVHREDTTRRVAHWRDSSLIFVAADPACRRWEAVMCRLSRRR